MTYTKEDNSISHYIYRKPTFVNSYLMYSSFHPQAHKLGVVDTLLTRALRLCDGEHVQEEIRNVFDMSDRGYPEKLIHKCLQLVQEKEESRKYLTEEDIKKQKEELEKTPRVILPFFGKTTNKIARFLRVTLNVEIGYHPGIKLSMIIPDFKFKSPKPIVGIYEVSCNDPITNLKSDIVYIGETGKSLEERQLQQINDIRNDNPNSAVATHLSRSGHVANDMQLIEYEPRTLIRNIKEALYIRAVPKKMNNNNGYRLHPIWSSRLVEFLKLKYKISKDKRTMKFSKSFPKV